MPLIEAAFRLRLLEINYALMQHPMGCDCRDCIYHWNIINAYTVKHSPLPQ